MACCWQRYAGFKVEHARPPCTRLDPGRCLVSRYGQSLYSFPHAYKHNFSTPGAWRPSAWAHLPALHWRNELIWWYAISALFLLGFSPAFGWLGAIFFSASR